ncbi:Egl nine-like 2 [Hondaea fermentalgiana]|uniref:Egl nine-like 2 n=1 Tax=Hondaea fermentalgiana TaxID=2315210 RepID=A0A2R5G7V7_9STRA|nr:Egl nine-like 2 [Hondaea fermentalgiana]|eukprot:GBG27132.1 Egl nine-like 2 [Hondaea fermentalgiana]
MDGVARGMADASMADGEQKGKGSPCKLLALPGSAFGLVMGFLDAREAQALRTSCRVFALVTAHLMRAASACYDVHDADDFLRRPTIAVVHPWVALCKRYSSLSPYTAQEWDILVQLAFLRGKLSALLLYRSTQQIGSMVVDTLCMKLLPPEFSDLILQSSEACISALDIPPALLDAARSCQRQVYLGAVNSSIHSGAGNDVDDEDLDDVDDVDEDLEHADGEMKANGTDDLMEDSSSMGDWRTDNAKRSPRGASRQSREQHGDAMSIPRTRSRSEGEEDEDMAPSDETGAKSGHRGQGQEQQQKCQQRQLHKAHDASTDDGDVEMAVSESAAEQQQHEKLAASAGSRSTSTGTKGFPAAAATSFASRSNSRNSTISKEAVAPQNIGCSSSSVSSGLKNSTHSKNEDAAFREQDKLQSASVGENDFDPEDAESEEVAERLAILSGSSRSEDFYHQKQDALNAIVNLVENQFAFCSRVLRFPLWNAACSVAEATQNKILTSERVASLYTNGFCIIDDFISEGAVRAVFQRCVDFVKMTNSVLNLPADELEKLGLPEPSSFFMMRGDPPSARGDCLLWLNREVPPGSKPPFSGVMDQFTLLYEELGSVVKLQGGREAQLAFYPDQGESYRRHRDATPDDATKITDNRRISAICYCNPNWDESHGGKPVLDLRPLPGRLVVFLSGLLDHEVRPSFHGRVAITNWFW